MFGEPLPSFSLRGESEVRTWCGGLVSVMAISATFMFALSKLQILLTRKNPSVTKYINEGAISIDDNFDLYENDFMIAFSLIDGIT